MKKYKHHFCCKILVSWCLKHLFFICYCLPFWNPLVIPWWDTSLFAGKGKSPINHQRNIRNGRKKLLDIGEWSAYANTHLFCQWERMKLCLPHLVFISDSLPFVVPHDYLPKDISRLGTASHIKDQTCLGKTAWFWIVTYVWRVCVYDTFFINLPFQLSKRLPTTSTTTLKAPRRFLPYNLPVHSDHLSSTTTFVQLLEWSL